MTYVVTPLVCVGDIVVAFYADGIWRCTRVGMFSEAAGTCYSDHLDIVGMPLAVLSSRSVRR